MKSLGSSIGGARPTRGMGAPSSRALCEPESRQELHLNPWLRGEGCGFVWLETAGLRGVAGAWCGVSADADSGRALMGHQGIIES